MKRMMSYCLATGMALLVLTATRALSQDPTPPGPGDEWQQEDWTTSTPPRRNRPMRFGGGMRGQGPVFGPVEFQQQMQDMQSRIFGMQNRVQDMQRLAEESKNNAIRQSLGVNDQQWARIKPRLDRIERFKTEANASLDPGSLGGGSSFVTGGGWAGGFSTFGGSGQPGQSWNRYETFGPGSSRTTRSGAGALTQAETLCEELHNLLQAPGAPPTQISQKVAALRQAKQRAQRQLDRERTHLRGLVNPQQEAALIVMGYLD